MRLPSCLGKESWVGLGPIVFKFPCACLHSQSAALAPKKDDALAYGLAEAARRHIRMLFGYFIGR